jgi:hypothetical protein
MADGKANITAIPASPRDRVDTQRVVKDRPLVYPTTTFGLVKRGRGERTWAYDSRSTPQPNPSGPPVKAGPAKSRPTVTVDFAPVDGVWLIAHAAMDFVLRFGFLSYAGGAEFHTADTSFPAVEPDWMFDASALRRHHAVAPAPTGGP